MENQFDPNGRWRPLTPEQRAKDKEWKNKYGYKFSDMNLSWEDVEILDHPFRSTKEHLMFAMMRDRGLLPPITEPVPLAEMRDKKLSPEEVDCLIIERLGNKKNVELYIKLHALRIKGFRQVLASESQHGSSTSIQDSANGK